MINFLKKYWFFVLLGFIATILIVIDLFVADKNLPVETPTSVETFKGVTPGKTTTEELSQILGAPSPQESDFSKDTLAYIREGGGPSHLAIIQNGVVGLFKQKALSGNLSDYVKKYGAPQGEYYGDEQEAGYKTYVWAPYGVAVIASANDGLIFEVWYFQPTTLDKFLETWGKNLTKEYSPQDF